MRRPRIAIDMDEVIADAHTEHATWYENNFGYDFTEVEIEKNSLRSLVSEEHHEKLEERLHRGEGFADYAVIPGAQDALSELSDKFDIFITTAAMEYPASCAPKFSWLRTNFPSISPMNIVFCGDKSILATDYLIDDNVRHFEYFQGQGMLFSAPHNLYVNYPVKVSCWEDAVAFLNGRI